MAEKLFRLDEEGLPAMFALPIVASHKRLGYLCAVTDAAEPSAMEMLVLEHSATIAALEMAQDRVRFETEVRLKGDFVDDVITGGERAGDSLLRRGAFLGCDLSQGSAVLLLGVDEFDGTVTRKNLGEEELEAAIERFFTQVLPLRLGEGAVLARQPQVGPDRGLRLRQDRPRPGSAAQAGDRHPGVGPVGGPPRASRPASAASSPTPPRWTAATRRRSWLSRWPASCRAPGALLHFQDVGTYRLLLDIWETGPRADPLSL